MADLEMYIPEEFVALCEHYKVTPERVLRGFIADLCQFGALGRPKRTDGMCTNGSDETLLAWEYFCRVGYPWNLPQPNTHYPPDFPEEAVFGYVLPEIV